MAVSVDTQKATGSCGSILPCGSGAQMQRGCVSSAHSVSGHPETTIQSQVWFCLLVLGTESRSLTDQELVT